MQNINNENKAKIKSEYMEGANPAEKQLEINTNRIFSTIEDSGMDLTKTLIYLKGERIAVFGTSTVLEELDDEDPTFYNALVDLIVRGAPMTALERAKIKIDNEIESLK